MGEAYVVFRLSRVSHGKGDACVISSVSHARVKIVLFLGFLVAGVKIESSPEFFMAVRTQHAVMLDITTCSIRAVVQTVAAGSKPQGY